MTAEEQSVLDIYQGIFFTLKFHLSLNPAMKDLFIYIYYSVWQQK